MSLQALVHTLSELSRVLHAHSLIDSCVSADPGLIPKGMNPADVSVMLLYVFALFVLQFVLVLFLFLLTCDVVSVHHLVDF